MLKNYPLPCNFTITAHTGCEDTPDNTVESIIKACNSGADIFEVDVQFDNNGIPVLSHDDIIGGEVTMEEAFVIMNEYTSMKCNIDIKKITNMKIIPEIAKKYNVLDRVFYTGINTDFVEGAKATPEIQYYLNYEIEPIENHSPEYYNNLINIIKDNGAIGINCHHKNVTEELINVCHNNKLLVSVWTCDDKADVMRIAKMNPDNITTRKPGYVKELLYKLTD